MKEHTIKGWIARNEDNSLGIFFLCPPQRINEKRYKYWFGGTNNRKQLDNNWFPEITWESDPVEVELSIKIA